MTAIVTGSAGFIGSRLVRELNTRSSEAVVEIDSATGPSIQDTTWLPPGRVDVIYHLASPVGPVGVLSWAGRLAFEVIDCARIVASWALRYGCPLIYVSTSEVYGSGQEDHEDDPCIFQAATSARKEYAVAKLAAETMLRNTPGLDVRIVRPFNVAGPGQKPDGGFVIPRFIEQARRGEPLTVYAPGTQHRSFTHVADVVDGLILAAERGKPGEVYNLGNARNRCSIDQLATEIDEAVNGPRFAPSRVIVDPVAIHGPAFREAPEKWPNGDKAYHELGWAPSRDRARIIADAIGDLSLRAVA